MIVTAALFAIAALTPLEVRGQKIYRTGEGSAPITALVGADDVQVPASVMPCGSCHGRDGRGRAEGGIQPSNLQWSSLTKPYAVANQAGRSHPPYTLPLLKRAITMGVDPAGNHLLRAMPRFRMSMQDANDLVAYLHKLGTDRDPGLTDDAITIGVVLPPGGEGDAIRETLTSYYETLPPVFGRKLDVRFDVHDEPFAIIAASPFADANVPTIDALGSSAIDSDDVFHLLAGIREQSLALANAVPGTIRIVHDAANASLAASLEDELHDRIRADATTVLLLGGTFDDRAKTLLVPAPFAAAVAKFDGRVLVALPKLQPMSGTHAAARTAALASAQLLTRALERAGRDVDRESLIATLNSFRGEATALVPPVTWTPSNHVGSSEVAIVEMRPTS